MVCPKCNERTLIPVIVKGQSQEGYLCDNCEVIWNMHKGVGIVSGISVHSITGGMDLSYTIKERPSPDNDNIPVRKTQDSLDSWHERYIR